MSIIDQVLGQAQLQLGKPYVWGAAGPAKFDCSGLISYCFAAVGISLPHNAAEQQRSSKVQKVASPQPGDLVFYGNPAHHVALYIGNGQQIAAPHTGDVVKVQKVSSGATYGRVQGLGVGSTPAGGALLDLAGKTGSGIQNVSFSVDDFFKQAQGVSLQVAGAILGLGLVAAGMFVIGRPARQKALNTFKSAQKTVVGAVV